MAVRHCGAKAVDQRSFHQRLTKVALHPPGQHALVRALIRMGGDQDRGDCLPTFDQMIIKLDTRHFWHVNIGDQAGCGRKFRRRKKMRCRREHRDRVIQRLEKPAHGVAERLVIIDDRD